MNCVCAFSFSSRRGHAICSFCLHLKRLTLLCLWRTASSPIAAITSMSPLALLVAIRVCRARSASSPVASSVIICVR